MAKNEKKPAAAAEKPVKPAKAPKAEFELVVDERGIPVTKDDAGKLIIGIKGPDFTAHVEDPKFKFEGVKAKLQYMVDLAQDRLDKHVNSKDPKAKGMAKLAKLRAEEAKLKAELGIA